MQTLGPPPVSAFARLQLGIEDTKAVAEGILIDHAVEVLKQEGQRLAFVQTGLLRKAAQAAVSILGHRGVEAACEAKAFWHVCPSLWCSARRACKLFGLKRHDGVCAAFDPLQV